MKLSYIIISLTILFTACNNSGNLDKEDAQRLLQEQGDFPKIIELELFTADPVDAKRILEAGLEKEGYVKISRTLKFKDIGESLITFSGKAKPFLLPQTNEDLKSRIQRVKVAEESVNEVVSVDIADDGNSAVITFKSSMENKTPFFNLSSIADESEKIKRLKVKIE